MKANQRLRRNLHLLSPGNPIHPGANTTSGDRSNGRPFTTSGEGPNNRTQSSAAAGLGSRILPASIPLLGKRVRNHIDRMFHGIDPCQLNR
jgi:hypothetical protein